MRFKLIVAGLAGAVLTAGLVALRAQVPGGQAAEPTVEQMRKAVSELRGGRIPRPASYDAMTADQKAHLGEVLKTLVEPYRETDRAEVDRCLAAQGGIDECRLSFYSGEDIGEDKVWDNWRLEGPSFVWYFRGAPHVHVWVNVADTPDARITTAG